MRNIRDVLLGNPAVEVIRPWDATVSVVVESPVLAITDMAGLTYSNVTENLTIDLTNAPPFDGQVPGVVVGVAKTNIELNGLTPGAVFRMGIQRTTAVDPSSPTMTGMILLPKSGSAAGAQTMLQNLFFSGNVNGASFVFTQALAYGGQIQTQVAYGLTTADSPSIPVEGNVRTGYNPPMITLTGTESLYLVLGKTETGIQIGYIDETTDGTAYDLEGAVEILGVTTPLEDYALFYFILTLDYGFGYDQVSILPKVYDAPLGYEVAGGSYEATGGTQLSWDTLFPKIPTDIAMVTITDAVFPTGTNVSHILAVSVDPLVTEPSLPYGLPVFDGDYVIVNNITPGQESFITIVETTDIPAILSGLVTAQTANANAIIAVNQELALINQSIINAANNITTATINAPEVLIFVSSTIGTDYGDMPFEVAYATFAEAYAYAITLPAIVKKRIIFDDRVSVPVVIPDDANVVYLLVLNNIVLSTFIYWWGIVPDLSSDVTHGDFSLEFRADGYTLDYFRGAINAPFTLSGGGSQPIYSMASGTLVIQNNSVVEISTQYMDEFSGGTILLGEGSQLKIWLYDAVFYVPVIIKRVVNSSVRIVGNILTPAQSIYFENAGQASIHNKMPWKSQFDEIATYPSSNVSYEYTAYDKVFDIITKPSFGLQVIRKPRDFGILQPGGYYSIGSPSSHVTYLVLGSIDLESAYLRQEGSVYPWDIRGMLGSSLTSTGKVLSMEYINGGIKARDIDFITSSWPEYAISSIKDLSLINCNILASKPLNCTGTGGKIVLKDINTRLHRSESVTVRTPLSFSGISSLTIRNMALTMLSGVTPINFNSIQRGPGKLVDIDIDGLDLTFLDTVYVPVFSLTSPYPLEVNPTSFTRIRNLKSNVRDTYLFSLDGLLYDHTVDNSIVVDNKGDFAEITSASISAWASTGVSTLLTGTFTGRMHGFRLDDTGVRSTGQFAKRFLVKLRAVISAAQAGQTITVSLVQIINNVFIKSATVVVGGASTVAERTVVIEATAIAGANNGVYIHATRVSGTGVSSITLTDVELLMIEI